MTATSGRLPGLDAWRAGLILAGLLVHGVLWQEPRPLFTAIALASNAFRMGVFFALSGYLTAVSLERTGAAPWLLRRAVSLGVPLAFGITCLSPFCWLLAQVHPALNGRSLLPFDWHHLWFLAALLLYGGAAAWWDGQRGVSRQRLLGLIHELVMVHGAPRASRLLLATALLGAAAGGIADAVAAATAPLRWHGMLVQVRYIAGYLPMFALGFAAARSSAVRETLLRNVRPAVLALGVLVAGYVGWFQAAGDLLPQSVARAGFRLIPAAAAFLAPPLVFVLVLRTAAAVRCEHPVVRWLSDASYTVYVVHLPLLLAANTALAFVPFDPLIEYVVAVLSAGVLSLVTYGMGVRRSRTLALLLSGRVASRGERRLRPA